MEKLKTIYTLIFFFTFFICYTQEEPGYDFECISSEREEYQKTNRYKSFKPASKRTVKRFHKKLDWIDISKSKSTTPYISAFSRSAYNDSIYKYFKLPLTTREMVAIWDNAYNDTIGPVIKANIIKHGINGDTVIILHTEFATTPWSSYAIWISLSYDEGLSWQQYPTGLSQNAYYHFKHNTNNNIFLSDSTIAFEVAIVRKVQPTVLPVGAPVYELISDGYLAEFNINKLSEDTDKDGLSNIQEKIFGTNILSADTDGDGICDKYDTNPKYKPDTNDTALLYYIASFANIPLGVESKKYILHDYAEAKADSVKNSYFDNYIVSDNYFIRQIRGTSLGRVITYTKEEYDRLLEWHPESLTNKSITPLFRCDNRDDTYYIHISERTWGHTFIVFRTKTGWKFVEISSDII